MFPIPAQPTRLVFQNPQRPIRRLNLVPRPVEHDVAHFSDRLGLARFGRVRIGKARQHQHATGRQEVRKLPAIRLEVRRFDVMQQTPIQDEVETAAIQSGRRTGPKQMPHVGLDEIDGNVCRIRLFPCDFQGGF